MQYFVATTDGSRLGLDELFERMERNGAKESRITFSRGADDLIRLDAFVMEIDEAGAEVLREYVAAGRIELKVIKDLARTKTRVTIWLRIADVRPVGRQHKQGHANRAAPVDADQLCLLASLLVLLA